MNFLFFVTENPVIRAYDISVLLQTCIAQGVDRAFFPSQHVIEEARRNLGSTEKLRKLDSCLSKVQVVTEADPKLSCPIDLPEKNIPVFMAAVTAKADCLLTGDIAHFGKYFGKNIMRVKILSLSLRNNLT